MSKLRATRAQVIVAAIIVVLAVALGNALGALIIPAARLVYQPKEKQPHWE